MQRIPVSRHPSEVVAAIDRGLVGTLQRQHSYPSVSVLLSTTPGHALSTRDVLRMDHLVRLADLRLRDAAPAEDAVVVVRRLQRLASAVRRTPASRAVALFASPAHAEAVPLPVSVEDRVVVDATFATRDLVRALRAVDRFRLVVIDLHGLRVLEGHAGRLDEIGLGPLPASGGSHRRDRSRAFGHDRSDVRDALLHARIRAADVILAQRRLTEPLPLILAGVERHLALFRSRSAEASTVVGAIVGSHRRTPLSRLAKLAAPIVEEHQLRRRSMGLARLDAGAEEGRALAGITDVLAAARAGRVELLCVEESLKVPEYVPAGSAISPPVDDIVDELIEIVALTDGEVVLVDDGRLSGYGGVGALVSRPRHGASCAA